MSREHSRVKASSGSSYSISERQPGIETYYGMQPIDIIFSVDYTHNSTTENQSREVMGAKNRKCTTCHIIADMKEYTILGDSISLTYPHSHHLILL